MFSLLINEWLRTSFRHTDLRTKIIKSTRFLSNLLVYSIPYCHNSGLHQYATSIAASRILEGKYLPRCVLDSHTINNRTCNTALLIIVKRTFVHISLVDFHFYCVVFRGTRLPSSRRIDAVQQPFLIAKISTVNLPIANLSSMCPILVSSAMHDCTCMLLHVYIITNVRG